ncbi:hypothetical protein OYC64_019221 [Pagothenia borchgrevinki]|uniref:Uncharacterized protein n=1 Tax=Pagothenia borchgrevinki TaxID=8213 RepID=A0ABD2GTB9_PAGBO
MAVSTALFNGVSVEDICTAASWSTPGPFIRSYLLDMSDRMALRVHFTCLRTGGEGLPHWGPCTLYTGYGRVNGVSVEDICTAASWSTPGPFIRSYLLDMSDSFSSSVLAGATHDW